MIKYATLTTVFIVSMFNIVLAADKYKVGDELYVWAKSDLNMRTGAGTDFEILTKVDYGEKITVLEKTDKPYKLAAITQLPSGESDIKPLYFNGYWVEVETESGEIGYIIDQYLLGIAPFEAYNPDIDLNLNVLIKDTLYTNPVHEDGEGLNYIELHIYEHGVIKKIEGGGVWSSETFYLPNFTLEEAMILFHNVWDNKYSEAQLYKTSTTEIIFEAHIQCTYKLMYKNDFVKVEIDCSC